MTRRLLRIVSSVVVALLLLVTLCELTHQPTQQELLAADEPTSGMHSLVPHGPLDTAADFAVAGTYPPGNGRQVNRGETISVALSQAPDSTTVNRFTLAIRGSLTGQYTETLVVNGTQILFNATPDYKPGETVIVNLTSGIESTEGVSLPAHVWQFWAAVLESSGILTDSGQTLGDSDTRGLALGDLDGDGDVDAFAANWSDQPNRVWLNDGTGTFSAYGSGLGSSRSHAIALGDLDSDGDLDAFVANTWAQANRVWLNNGNGGFTSNGQALGNQRTLNVALGDLDGDGDLDAFVANTLGDSNKVWINNGTGTFSDSGQSLGTSYSRGLALGDVDADGDLDAFTANANGEANRVWINNGAAIFSDSGQRLGSSTSRAVALADLDADGDLDAFVANAVETPANRVWVNDGQGNFSDSGQLLGDTTSDDLGVGDLDGDGDMDAFTVGGLLGHSEVWLNNGSGLFTYSDLPLPEDLTMDVAMADLDGDGDLDVFLANINNTPNRILFDPHEPPDPESPRIAYSPAELYGTQPPDAYASQPLTITNVSESSTPLEWALEGAETVDWLLLSRSTGGLTPAESDTIQVIYNSAGLASGTYASTLWLNSNDSLSPSVPISVHLEVRLPEPGSPRIAFSPTELSDTLLPEMLASHRLTITNIGESPTPLQWLLDGADAVDWLLLSRSSGSLATAERHVIQVVFSSSGLVGGTYTTTLLLTSNDALSPSVDIPVTLNVQPLHTVMLPLVMR